MDNKDPAAATKALVLHSQTTAIGMPQSIFPTTFEAAMKLAEYLADSPLLPEKLRKSPSSVFMTILTGLDLGISPAAALRSIHVVEGRPYLSAQLKVAICKARRDLCEYFDLTESTDEKATWETKRVGRAKPQSYTFTRAMAQTAGLLDRGNDPKFNNWNRYPAAMCRARASSILCDLVYQEVIVGVRTTEEAEDEGVIGTRETSPGVFEAVASVPQPAPRPAPAPAQAAPAASTPAGPDKVPPLPTEPTRPPSAEAVPEMTVLDKFFADMDACQTKQQLNALASRINEAKERKLITDDEATSLRKAWSTAFAAATSVPPAGGGR